MRSFSAPACYNCFNSRWVGNVANPRSDTNRARRVLDTPLVNQAASWVVVTARDSFFEISDDCAAEAARINRDSSHEALILTRTP